MYFSFFEILELLILCHLWCKKHLALLGGQFDYDKINQLVKIVGLPIKVIYKYLSPDGRIDQYIEVFGKNNIQVSGELWIYYKN